MLERTFGDLAVEDECLVEMIGADGVPQRREVASVIRNVDAARFEDFGLTLDESKNIQRNLQAEFGQFQGLCRPALQNQRTPSTHIPACRGIRRIITIDSSKPGGALDVSFQGVVHSDRGEETGVAERFRRKLSVKIN